MKLSIILAGVCVLFIGAQAKNMQQLENSMDTCLTKAGATKEELEKFIAGEDIPKLKCFWECVMMADGTMSPTGEVDEDKVIAEIPADMPDREKVVEAVKACIGERGIDGCETANKIERCVVSKLHKD